MGFQKSRNLATALARYIWTRARRRGLPEERRDGTNENRLKLKTANASNDKKKLEPTTTTTAAATIGLKKDIFNPTAELKVSAVSAISRNLVLLVAFTFSL